MEQLTVYRISTISHDSKFHYLDLQEINDDTKWNQIKIYNHDMFLDSIEKYSYVVIKELIGKDENRHYWFKTQFAAETFYKRALGIKDEDKPKDSTHQNKLF